MEIALGKLRFFYLKSPNHADIKVDGALGGPAATGDRILMSIYTERPAIPQVVVYQLSENGELGDEIVEEREGKDGLIRTVHATLDMDPKQARAVRDWLSKQIEQLDDLGTVRINDGSS